MKKLFFAMLMAVCMCACSAEDKAIDQLKDLADDIKENAEAYTAEDWEAVCEHYEDIVDEIENLELTLEQKKEIARIKSEINDLISDNSIDIFKKTFKQGLGDILDVSKDFLETIDSVANSLEEE